MNERGTIVVLNRGWICSALSAWLWSLDRARYHYEPIVGGEIARGRNRGVVALRGDFVLFVDSDCVPEHGAAERLDATGLSIVGAVYLERSETLDVCATRTFEPTVRFTLDEMRGETPIPVLGAGTGCMLIRREVLDAVDAPWFRCGQLVVDTITEDAEFCIRAAEKGYITHVARDVRVGHVMKGTLWPHEDGSPWVQWSGSVYREPLGVLA